MFAEIEIKQPLEKVAEDWDLLADAVMPHFLGFRAVGHNVYGLRRRLITGLGVDDPRKGNVARYQELGPRGIEEGMHQPFRLRICAAGTPHRVLHNFGYWHINDKDELFVPVPGDGDGSPGYSVIMQGRPRGRESESFAWYCQKCLTLLFDFVVPTGEVGLAGFWKGEREAVSLYNREARLRTCVECGHVNPMGYCWNSAKDTPEEAEARRVW
jgi:hypothetical protein